MEPHILELTNLVTSLQATVAAQAENQRQLNQQMLDSQRAAEARHQGMLFLVLTVHGAAE